MYKNDGYNRATMNYNISANFLLHILETTFVSEWPTTNQIFKIFAMNAVKLLNKLKFFKAFCTFSMLRPKFTAGQQMDKQEIMSLY